MSKRARVGLLLVIVKLTIAVHTRANAVPAVAGRTDYDSEDEGYNGGEA